MDDIQGVDDIAKRLAHLSAMSITHNCMEIDLGARGEMSCEAMLAPPGLEGPPQSAHLESWVPPSGPTGLAS